ncbi:hypothetical protein ACWF82_20915 [Nocardia sp. NPDC055053]
MSTTTTDTDTSTIDPVESISNSDLARRVHLGTAGPITELGEDPVIARWRAQFPGWRGRHWTYRATDADTLRLHPLNVTHNRRTR